MPMDSPSANDAAPGSPGAPAPPARPELSDREREILILVATGASNKQIAQQLVISPNTVKVHVRNIFAKLSVASRTEAALFAIREGLVQVTGDAPAVAADDDPPAAPEVGVTAPVEPAAAPPLPAAPSAPPRRPARWALGLVIGVVVIGLLALSVWTYAVNQTTPTALVPTMPLPTALPRWVALADLPTARAGLAVTTYENQIYAIGGEAADGITGAVERYDPATGVWEDDLAPKPIPVTDVSAAVIAGQIYVPGGRQASGALSGVLEVYYPADDRWETRAALPMAVSGYALVAFEGQLYLFGGWDGERYRAEAFAYDPGRDAWRSLPAMPTARAFAGAAVASGLIYVVGGDSGAAPLAVNEAFLPTREAQGVAAWETRQPMPEGRTGLGLTSLADMVYAMGGQGTTAEFGAWSYQTAQNAWRSLDLPLAPATTRLGLATLQTRVHIVGGDQVDAPSQQHWSYQAIYTTIFPGVTGE